MQRFLRYLDSQERRIGINTKDTDLCRGSPASGFLRNDYRVAGRNQSRQSEAKSSQCNCPEGAPGLSIMEGNPLVLILAFDKLRFSGGTRGRGLWKGLLRTVANLTGRGGGVTISTSATDSEPLLQRLPSSEVGRSFFAIFLRCSGSGIPKKA